MRPSAGIAGYMVARRRQKKTTPLVRSSPWRDERVMHFPHRRCIAALVAGEAVKARLADLWAGGPAWIACFGGWAVAESGGGGQAGAEAYPSAPGFHRSCAPRHALCHIVSHTIFVCTRGKSSPINQHALEHPTYLAVDRLHLAGSLGSFLPRIDSTTAGTIVFRASLNPPFLASMTCTSPAFVMTSKLSGLT